MKISARLLIFGVSLLNSLACLETLDGTRLIFATRRLIVDGGSLIVDGDVLELADQRLKPAAHRPNFAGYAFGLEVTVQIYL